MKSRISWKMGHVGPKPRSPGKILEKPCVCSGGHIFILIIMKLDQHVCLYEISHKFENGNVRSKTRSLGKILEKSCVHYRGTFSVR